MPPAIAHFHNPLQPSNELEGDLSRHDKAAMQRWLFYPTYPQSFYWLVLFKESDDLNDSRLLTDATLISLFFHVRRLRWCGLNQLVYMCDSWVRWLHTCKSFQWSRVPAVLQTMNSTNRADVNTALSALMCHKSCPWLCLLSRHAKKWSASAEMERSGPTLKAQYPRSRWQKSVINYFIWSGGGAVPRRRLSSTSLVCCVKCKIVPR